MDDSEIKSLVSSESGTRISLYQSGSIFDRMTFELLPMATRQMQSDQDAASPLYQDGLSAISEGKSERAMTLLIGASELGHVEAQYRLGELYLDGSLFPVNHSEAGHWLQRASDQGDHRAQIRLGWMYEAGLGFKTDHARSVYWFRLAAEQGNMEAQFNLAAKYDNGEGVRHNPDEAVRWYRLAAEQGHADAQYFLGQAYEAGDGIEADVQEAIDWYILASEQSHASARRRFWSLCVSGDFYPEDDHEAIFAEQIGASVGHAGAQFILGFRYDIGAGVVQDLELAKSWYKKAATKGFKDACYHLSLLSSLGRGTPTNMVTSSRWTAKGDGIKSAGKSPDFKSGRIIHISGDGVTSVATNPSWMFNDCGRMDVNDSVEYRLTLIKADSGDIDAQFDLGYMYDVGESIIANDDQALKWYRLAADNGHTIAMNNLAIMLNNGRAGPVNTKEATKYFRRSAKLGDEYAMHNLAHQYLDGRGVKKNNKLGIKYMQGSADLGYANAQFYLGSYYQNGDFVDLADISQMASNS